MVTRGPQTACCFVAVGGGVATTPEQLRELMGSKEQQQQQLAGAGSGADAELDQLFAFDHVYPGERVGGSMELGRGWGMLKVRGSAWREGNWLGAVGRGRVDG